MFFRRIGYGIRGTGPGCCCRETDQQIWPFGAATAACASHCPDILSLDFGRGDNAGAFQHFSVDQAVFGHPGHDPVEQVGGHGGDGSPDKGHFVHVVPSHVVVVFAYGAQEPDHGQFAFRSEFTADSGHFRCLEK